MQKHFPWTMLAMIFIFNVSTAGAQTHTPFYNTRLSTNCNGYYEYLPAGYDPSGSVKYPLLIFFHGAGDLGNGSSTDLPKLLSVGIPKLINENKFPASFTVNGQTSSFIIISPQFSAWPTRAASVGELEAIIDYAVEHYKVNINRIYLTGLSMGGGFVFDYAGNNGTNAGRLAAIVPIAEASGRVYAQARTIASANLPVWATHNNQDPSVPVQETQQYVDWINEAPSPDPLAKASIFISNQHDAWTRTYDPLFTENGLNIYQWMLQYQRNFSALPVQIKNYKAVRTNSKQITISWNSLNEVNNSHFTLERSADNQNFNTIARIPGTNKDQLYAFTDNSPLNGDNFYRLSQTDLDGKTTYYEILKSRLDLLFSNLTINPNPVNDQLHFSYRSNEKGSLKVTIYNSAGLLIKQWDLNKQEEVYNETLFLGDLSKGNYLLKMEGRSGSQAKQFMVR
jgi:dienelactone hydrolase